MFVILSRRSCVSRAARRGRYRVDWLMERQIGAKLTTFDKQVRNM